MMMAMTAMAETATAMATAKATAMMLPPPLIQMMSMTMTVAIRGRRLDDSDWMSTMGQQQYASTMMAMTVMAETAKAMVMAMAMAMVTAMGTATETATPMMPPPSTAKMSMKTMAAIQGWRLDVNNSTTLM
jgi:hypothetical protein